MRELSGNHTFVVGLRVNEDGEMQFAPAGGILEIRRAADETPLALREVQVADGEGAEFAPWQLSERSE
jgi:hypothetical protein